LRRETNRNKTTTLKLPPRRCTVLIYFFVKGEVYDKKVVSHYRAGDGCLVINSGLRVEHTSASLYVDNILGG
jgi:hypothetical protein